MGALYRSQKVKVVLVTRPLIRQLKSMKNITLTIYICLGQDEPEEK